jgi:4-hydroxybenzoate polyprenyltransferase
MLKHLLRAMRPGQWTKNLLVFAGLIFARKVFSLDQGLVAVDWATVMRTLGAFAVFCLVSSATYLFNDINDLAADRVHPVKRRRPIAAGDLPVGIAALFAAVFFAAGLAGAAFLNWGLLAVVVAYLVVTMAYSLFLKHVVILDVLLVSVCYVLRAVAGAVTINVPFSVWLLLCTFLLALFLVLTKRRAELTSSDEQAANQRSVLAHYSPQLLDQMISVVTASTVVSYAIYTAAGSGPHAAGSSPHTNNLVLTLPFVIYGIFRYLYLVYRRQGGTEPDKALYQDIPLLANIVLYLLVTGALIYFFRFEL